MYFRIFYLCSLYKRLATFSFVYILTQGAVAWSYPVNDRLPASSEEQSALPLARVAHKDAMELIQRLLIPQPIRVATYKPFFQQIALKLNWSGVIWKLIQQPYYEGGIEVHLRNNMQFTADLGYAFAHTSCTKHADTKGLYSIGMLRYALQLNPATYAYIGIAYGQSRFSVERPSSLTKACTAYWTKLVVGSECRLLKWLPQLYGGMYLGIMHRLPHKPRRLDLMPDHVIPGYGPNIRNTNFRLDCYVKWTITFLKKKRLIWNTK